MTNNNPEQFISPLRSVRMNDIKRNTLRSQLLAYVRANPVRLRRAFWNILTRHALAFSMMVVFLLAGGTIALAYHAQPDSFFYPVRIALNDRIAVAMSGDEDAQLDKELEQIERMILEEEMLIEKKFADEIGIDETDSIEMELNSIQKELDILSQDFPAEE